MGTLKHREPVIEPGKNYSLEETLTGGFWLGKTVYRKVVNFGALPDSSVKNVAHNITGIEQVTRLQFLLKDEEGSPDFVFSHHSEITRMAVNDTNISVATSGSSYVYTAYVVIEYTKA